MAPLIPDADNPNAFVSGSNPSHEMVNSLAFLIEHATPIWVVLASLVSGLGAWLIRRPRRAATAKSTGVDTSPGIWLTETGQRTEFRTMLMKEIAGMRQVIKEYEVDTEVLRQRLNAALAQSLVLRATVEIMEKRVAFLKDRQAMHDHETTVAAQKSRATKA
jgi:hypothetical protein